MSRKFYFSKKWPLLSLTFQYTRGACELKNFRHLQHSCSLSQYICHQENWTMKYARSFCQWFPSSPILQFVVCFFLQHNCVALSQILALCLVHFKPVRTGGYWEKPSASSHAWNFSPWKQSVPANPLQSKKAVTNEEDVLPWTLAGSTWSEQMLDATPANGN